MVTRPPTVPAAFYSVASARPPPQPLRVGDGAAARGRASSVTLGGRDSTGRGRGERLSQVSRENAAGFGAVFEAVKRVVESRGVRHEGDPLITYSEAGVTLTRTPLNEYEVRTEAGVVFRARHTGALSSDPVFTPGDWIEEVRRMDRDVRKGGIR